MTEWVPCYPTDTHFMRRSDLGKRVFLTDRPVIKRAFQSACGKESFDERVPSQRRDLAFMATKHAEFFHHPNIEEQSDLISTCAEEPIRVDRTPFRCCDTVLMTVQCRDTSCGPCVPEFNKLVFCTSDNERVGWMPIRTGNVPAMPLKHSLLATEQEIPDLDGTVVGTTDKL